MNEIGLKTEILSYVHQVINEISGLHSDKSIDSQKQIVFHFASGIGCALDKKANHLTHHALNLQYKLIEKNLINIKFWINYFELQSGLDKNIASELKLKADKFMELIYSSPDFKPIDTSDSFKGEWLLVD